MAFNRHRLKELRLHKGISVDELSMETNIDRIFLYRLESGKRKAPGFETIERLADYFKVNMESFRDQGKPYFEKRRTKKRAA